MKKLVMTLRWLALLAMSYQVQAGVIVDTGAPNSAGFPLTLSSGQWLAAKFSTSQDWRIAGLEGFINADSGNPENATYTIALYGDSAAGLPDTDAPLFSRQASLGADGWNGLHDLNLALNAGSYWLAFEVRAADTLQGLLPVYVSNPLSTAWNDPISNDGYLSAHGNAYNFAVRISSVPVPASVWLFMSGLFALGRWSKRQTN
ncbi:hypothetical protein ACH50O_13175 [Methylomonas sp. 2BW1-5-20]|uniref:hypothetical protein n=1 Tax=Methylomonas sp. 2BW1-5-20 TaxID=3376686 RepID=UPI0040511ADD